MLRPPPSIPLRLLHYWWPVVMGWSLSVVVQRATGRAFNPTGLALLLCGIAAVYSLDRIEDVRAAPARWMAPLLLAVGALASALCLGLAWQLPWRTAFLLPAPALLVAGYPFVKRWPGTKTIVVAAVWTWSAVALPFAGAVGAWEALQVPVALPIFLLVAAGCVLCDLKDIERDRAARVGSLPALMGSQASITVAVVLAAAGVVAASAQHRPGLAIGGVCLALAGGRPALLGSAAIGPLVVDAILTLPGALIAARLV